MDTDKNEGAAGGSQMAGESTELPLRAEEAVAQLKSSLKPHEAASATPEESPATIPLEVIVKSDGVYKDVSKFPRRTAGASVYEPGRLVLAGYELDLNAIVQVKIAHRFLTDDPIKKRELWGTEIYTDDSDIVACLKHQGHLEKGYDGDLEVEIIVLPTLESYCGSYLNGLLSRTWSSPHDGISFAIHKVTSRPLGFADAGKESIMQRLADLAELRQ